MKITTKDIAKLANVSQCTVSKVLSNKSIRVKPATRERILKVAKDLNYIPNRSAKSLKTGKFNSIALIAYDIADAFAVEYISAMDQLLATSQYKVLWASCAHADIKKRKARELLYEITQSVDGIIIIAANRYIKDTDVINFWASTHIPIVSVIRTVPGDFASSVTIDEKLGTTSLLKHLIGLGHKKIAFCHARGENASGQKRYQVYCDIMEEQGLILNENHQIKVNGTPKNGYEAGLNLIKNSDPPTAIIGFNDLTAIGLLKACYDQGLSVPQDISIASFDNIRISELTTPALTTVAANFEQLANSSLNELIKRIESPTQQEDIAKHHIIKPKLIIRQSTAPPTSKQPGKV